jgi:hypothetical protein
MAEGNLRKKNIKQINNVEVKRVNIVFLKLVMKDFNILGGAHDIYCSPNVSMRQLIT